MEEHGPKALNIATTIVIALFIITLVFGLVMVGSRIANNGAAGISEITGQLEESSFTQYQGASVKGDQLIGIIKSFEGKQAGICVENRSGVACYLYDISDASLSDATASLPEEPFTRNEQSTALMRAQDKTRDEYITPTQNYIGTVLRDADSNAITGLYFIREDLVED